MNLLQIDRNHVWHPHTPQSNSKAMNMPVIAKGDQGYLIDINGEYYLDTSSSWWACNLGYSHPELVEAIKNQADHLQHSVLGSLSHPPIIELSRRLSNLFEDNKRHILYSSDGSSAVESAIKVSLQYWKNVGKNERNQLAYLAGAYHGDTLGSVSVGYSDKMHHYFASAINPGHKVPFPNCRNCKMGSDGNSTDCVCFEPMKNLFEEHGDKLAAVIVEPMCQGAGGMRVYSANYLKRLDEYCKKYDVLLIADEIAMGFGRTGKMFAHEHAGIDPDIICIAKALTNGYLPMSATIVKDYIYDTFNDDDPDNDKTFPHGHTYAGNPICASLALKVLDIYERDGVVQQGSDTAEAIVKQIPVFMGLSTVKDARSIGMVMAVELHDSCLIKGDVPLVEKIQREMFEEKIIMRTIGDVIYTMMPLITEKQVVIEVMDKLLGKLREYSD